MKYFLDFDRTLFDTGAFKEYVETRYALPFTGRVGELADAMLEQEITFMPGELSRFVYPDVEEFIERVGEAAVIITFGPRAVQEAKIGGAFVSLRVPVLYTESIRKGEYLINGTVDREGGILVDDTPLELESLLRHCPELTGYEMRRDGEQGDGRWPVIRSLLELP